MSSELNEAAARLRAWEQDPNWKPDGSFEYGFIEDQAFIAHSALVMGLFLEDDGERITRGWLLGDGWYAKDGSFVRDGVNLWLSPGNYGCGVFGEEYICTTVTRGQLRLLLRAIGVEVDNKP